MCLWRIRAFQSVLFRQETCFSKILISAFKGIVINFGPANRVFRHLSFFLLVQCQLGFNSPLSGMHDDHKKDGNVQDEVFVWAHIRHFASA